MKLQFCLGPLPKGNKSTFGSFSIISYSSYSWNYWPSLLCLGKKKANCYYWAPTVWWALHFGHPLSHRQLCIVGICFHLSHVRRIKANPQITRLPKNLPFWGGVVPCCADGVRKWRNNWKRPHGLHNEANRYPDGKVVPVEGKTGWKWQK